MKLDEILQLTHLPVKWLTDHTAIFEFNDTLFGIVLDTEQIELPTRTISVINILFGVVVDIHGPISADNINTTPTGFGKTRTIMTTVGYACRNNTIIQNYNIIIVAATDQVREKRIGIYSLVMLELSKYFPVHKHSYRAHPNGAILVVQSKIELTQDEIEYIGSNILNK